MKGDGVEAPLRPCGFVGLDTDPEVVVEAALECPLQARFGDEFSRRVRAPFGIVDADVEFDPAAVDAVELGGDRHAIQLEHKQRHVAQQPLP